MTLTTLLSARIRDLENRAAPLPDYQDELAEIEERREQLHASIEGAQAAAYQLELIGLHAEQVLNGTTTRVEITGGEEPLDEPTPEPEEAPKVPDVEPEEPVVVDTAPAEEEPEPTLERPAPPASIPERVLAYLAEHPNQTALEVGRGVGQQLSNASATLSRLQMRGQVVNDGARPARYRLPGQAAPLVESTPAPEPDAGSHLKADEQAVVDLLSDGALYKVHHVQGRLKWAATRTERTLNTLVRLGLVRLHENHYATAQQAAAD